MDLTFWLSLILFLTIILLIYRHITRNFNFWKINGVPYRKPIPIFGNIFKVVTLKQSLGHFVQEVHNLTNSRFTGFFVFDQPFLLIRDPELIKSIFIKDFEYFDNRTVVDNPRDDKIGSNVLFVMKNPTWKIVRTKLTPAFTTGKLKNMLYLMLEASEDMKMFINEAILSRDGVVESRELGMKYTTDVISSCAFGINAQSFKREDAEFRVAARRFFAFNFSRSIQNASYFVAPWLVKFFRMKFMETTSTNFMRKVFWEQMHQRKISGTTRGDLVDILLQMKETSSDDLDDDVVFAQVLQFFVAGFETTGSTIMFALYELALNQEIQRRLREEIRETVAKYGKLSYAAISSMKYLDGIVNETLRIYPALTFLDRRCSKPFPIPNSDVILQKGQPVYISLLGLHMDPKYFPEPEKFKPDRFTDENKGSILPFTYLPFGEGPRNCIGSRFGLKSAKIALISIVSNFEITADSTTPVPLTYNTKTGFLLAPESGKLNLRYKLCK